MRIADEAEDRFGRKVSWGLTVGSDGEDEQVLFTHIAVPVMTRLKQPERQVLDTLVDAGVARSRSDALAWSVKLVGEHAEEWLAKLRDAMTEVDDLRTQGPDLYVIWRAVALPTTRRWIASGLGHRPVGAAAGQQLGVDALLDDPARLHHQDLIGVADRRKPVRDDETRSVPAQVRPSPAESAARCGCPPNWSPRRGSAAAAGPGTPGRS